MAILEKETFEKFGYYPSDWVPLSHKKILAACDECGKIRNICKLAYRSLCISCASKKCVGKKHQTGEAVK